MKFHSKMCICGMIVINISYFSTTYVTCDEECYTFLQVFLGCLLVFSSICVTIVQIMCFHRSIEILTEIVRYPFLHRTYTILRCESECQCEVFIGTTKNNVVCKNPCICNII